MPRHPQTFGIGLVCQYQTLATPSFVCVWVIEENEKKLWYDVFFPSLSLSLSLSSRPKQSNPPLTGFAFLFFCSPFLLIILDDCVCISSSRFFPPSLSNSGDDAIIRHKIKMSSDQHDGLE